jgi:hypothetical protein
VQEHFNDSGPIADLPQFLLSLDDLQTNLQHLSHVQLTDCLCTIGRNPECSCADSSLAIAEGLTTYCGHGILMLI